MNHRERELLRQAMDVQFRYQLYQKPEFRFMHSLGIKDIFQGFGNTEIGMIGVLHLYWKENDIWLSKWYDTPEEGRDAQQKVWDDSPFDREKLMHARMRDKEERERKKSMPIEEPEEPIILN